MARILQQQPQQQHNHHEDSFAMENDDDDDCYEDLPPKQIWTTRSSASSEISPLREKQSRIQARQIIMGKVPALCTPDSTQTTTEDTTSGEDDDEGGPTTLGIAAAPFYSNEISNPSVSTFAEETSTQHDDDDDISSSIPSFNTRRMILDLQDELARTKAELEHLRCGMPAEQLDFDAVSGNSTHAVVVEESELQLRFQKSEQRVVALQDKLKESHSIARRLHGTLRTVQKRMQHYALADLQCAGEDVVFMESIANLLALCFLVAPFLLFHWNDVGLFALLIGVTLAAVEIAIRP